MPRTVVTKVDRGAVSLAMYYLDIKAWLIGEGFGPEIDWQADREFGKVTESDFLREAAWVVLSSGFREAVVRRCFSRISNAFLEWRSAEEICEHRDLCEKEAFAAFGNQRKISAIGDIVGKVAVDGIARVKEEIRLYGVEYLQEFSYIGPVTAYHLAKNLGLGVVKPDRHLVRMARCSGYDSPTDMCEAVETCVGDPVSVVDVVLWRYATLNSGYENEFRRVVKCAIGVDGMVAGARRRED